MKNLFSKYQKSLGTIFSLWLLLVIIKKFGFDFRMDLSVFFKIFLFLLIIWLTWLIKIRWLEISPIMRKVWKETKDEFIVETNLFTFLFSFLILPWRLTRKYFFNQATLLVIVVFGIFFDIFIFKFTSDLIILFLTGLWILSIRCYKLGSRISILGSLMFLIICPFLLIFHWDMVAEKSAVWAYVFLVVGIGQMFIEYLKEKREDAKKEG